MLRDLSRRSSGTGYWRFSEAIKILRIRHHDNNICVHSPDTNQEAKEIKTYYFADFIRCFSNVVNGQNLFPYENMKLENC